MSRNRSQKMPENTRYQKMNFFRFLVIFFVLAFLAFGLLGFVQASPQDEKTALELELKELEAKILQYENDITKTQQEKNTLQNQVSVLKKKVSQLDAQIKKSNLIINDLGVQIEDTGVSIDKTSLKVEDSKARLASVLRTLYEEDQRSLIEVLLAEPELSDFFDNIMTLEALNQKNKEFLNNIKNLKAELESQRETLDGEKDDLERATKLQMLQKQENLNVQKQQEVLLQQTKGKESEYQKMLQDTRKRATEIRAKLFGLIGVAKAPTFGEALEVAKGVAYTVGIRPSFLLAIISQESEIGRNVGQCVLTDPVTGYGKRISTGAAVARLMKPTRDIQPFLRITASLGRDPYNTPVSCPLSIGYGGAMGPAQFIPSTWNLYFEKLAGVLGRPGDPWAIADSFTAAGLYLADLGATAKTAAKESSAASRYYGGSSSYASSVMSRANCIQGFIDSGTMSPYCESLIF
mgnify:CR=1 FL=1